MYISSFNLEKIKGKKLEHLSNWKKKPSLFGLTNGSKMCMAFGLFDMFSINVDPYSS